ncbi:MAG: hypothetical protein GY841_16000 [FCB group bacterium]|nr:hypothetical protein [FCB group bacterium]
MMKRLIKIISFYLACFLDLILRFLDKPAPEFDAPDEQDRLYGIETPEEVDEWLDRRRSAPIR